MATGDDYKIVVNATFASNWYQNSVAMRWKAAGDPTNTNLLEVADDVKELFRPSQASLLAYVDWNSYQLWGPNMSIDAPKCRRLNGHVDAGPLTAPLAGGGSGSDVLPPQCAFVTTLVTGIAGRRKRGRLYTTGYAESLQAGGAWDATLLTIQNTRWVTFLAEYADGGTSPRWEFGVWSERTASGCVPNPSGKGHIQVDTPHPELAFTPIVSVVTRSVVYTQRRRALGVGR